MQKDNGEPDQLSRINNTLDVDKRTYLIDQEVKVNLT